MGQCMAAIFQAAATATTEQAVKSVRLAARHDVQRAISTAGQPTTSIEQPYAARGSSSSSRGRRAQQQHEQHYQTQAAQL